MHSRNIHFQLQSMQSQILTLASTFLIYLIALILNAIRASSISQQILFEPTCHQLESRPYSIAPLFGEALQSK